MLPDSVVPLDADSEAPAPAESHPQPVLRNFEPGESCNSYFYEVAAQWAEHGWPVIPLEPGGKKRRTRPGTKASTDPKRIERWWSRWPDSNVGIVLDGLKVIVLDPDGAEGEKSLARLQRETGTGLPPTYTVTTGRPGGGRHLWYRLPEGAPALVSQYGNPSKELPPAS